MEFVCFFFWFRLIFIEKKWKLKLNEFSNFVIFFFLKFTYLVLVVFEEDKLLFYLKFFRYFEKYFFIFNFYIFYILQNIRKLLVYIICWLKNRKKKLWIINKFFLDFSFGQRFIS